MDQFEGSRQSNTTVSSFLCHAVMPDWVLVSATVNFKEVESPARNSKAISAHVLCMSWISYRLPNRFLTKKEDCKEYCIELDYTEAV